VEARRERRGRLFVDKQGQDSIVAIEFPKITDFGVDPLRFHCSRRADDGKPIGPVERTLDVGAEVLGGSEFLLVPKYATYSPMVRAVPQSTRDHEGLQR
jgi:hypothetical protein